MPTDSNPLVKYLILSLESFASKELKYEVDRIFAQKIIVIVCGLKCVPFGATLVICPCLTFDKQQK